MKIEGNKNWYTHQIPEFKVNGKIVKQDDRYIVEDNTFLKKLILSSTLLNPGKETSGHKHKGQEEIYFFINGEGKMKIDEETFKVKAGDIILIEDGEFHKVFNTSRNKLYFVCVFDGKRKI